MDFSTKTKEQTLRDLKTTTQGLSNQEAKKRIEINGLNNIQEKKKKSMIKIIAKQFTSPLIIILIVATSISAFVGESVDAIVIGIIILLNATLWFIQEYRAEKAIEALKKLTKHKAKVIREGKEYIIDASDLTIGDIIIIESGDKIPADARLIEEVLLEVQEAILTGESLPVAKNIDKIPSWTALADKKNMIYGGTQVTKWHGKAVVVAIGMQTEIGKIANMIQEAPDKITNLEKKLWQISKRIGIGIGSICIVVFFMYYLVSHIEVKEAFFTAIALAVAAVPEGLAAVVTITLALWVKRFVKKNALIRTLASTETLWSVDIICTDKTGTLTKNEMTVQYLFANNNKIFISGTGYKIYGEFSENPKKCTRLLEIGVLCNLSYIDGENIIWDPTEAALLVSAAKAGITKQKLTKTYKRTGEIPFDESRKMMSTLYTSNEKEYIFSKWAPEIILEKCSKIEINGKILPLTTEHKQDILDANTEFASKALRVLGFAYNTGKKESWLIFVGLQAMIDPPRDEVKNSIAECKKAGIRVIMITWDNIQTAQAIGKYLGISGKAILGEKIEKTKNISKILRETSIFARVNPQHKLRIVQELKKLGHVVAMTGDGINDAPALKTADIWVAMGITGTDVSKDAADVILLDDNFASIVHAVREGRWIYENIQKFVNYLFSYNLWEVAVIFLATIGWLPLPLLPIQLLRVNLITDGLPALALGIDPINPEVMNNPPRSKKEHIITPQLTKRILFIAAMLTVGIGYIFLKRHHQDLYQARTGVFLVMVLMELIGIQIIRGRYHLKIFSNMRLIGAILLSIALTFGVIYSPLRTYFGTVIPTIALRKDIGIVIITAIIIGFFYNKISKKIDR